MTTTSPPPKVYLKRKKRYLRDFDRIVKSSRAVLETHFGKENIPALLAQTRQEFEHLIPKIPYIGGKKPFTQFLVSTAMLLALYRTSTAYGKTLEQTGQIIYEIEKAFIQSTPAFLLRMFSPLSFSRRSQARLRRRAEDSHLREYPGDYVFNYVQGNGTTFDYGVDYLECGSCKFLNTQGAPELAPYICPVDILYSETLGWGLVRTQTLAEGANRCDFRFKKGGPTRVRVPESMQDVVMQVDK